MRLTILLLALFSSSALYGQTLGQEDCGITVAKNFLNCANLTDHCSGEFNENIFEQALSGHVFTYVNFKCCGENFPNWDDLEDVPRAATELRDPHIRENLLRLNETADLQLAGCDGYFRPFYLRKSVSVALAGPGD